DVWCSWKSEEQRGKVSTKVAAFNSIWNNTEPNVQIVEFPDLKQEILDRYKHALIFDYASISKYEESNDPFIDNSKYCYAVQIPQDVVLHQYQVYAIDEWVKHGYRGIFDMATGTGKTYTGLGAVARLCESVNNKLAVVVV
ncbi:DEAD/DEAH box helicase family protein, partial [Dehalococcoides mccartyi]|uniref:DEAD/DEAH box helicase family protein n=1 Tax=Dehalococcoides mccartyi TaxID=61435 RepID=UPI000AC92995